jgi:hypothetical protein
MGGGRHRAEPAVDFLVTFGCFLLRLQAMTHVQTGSSSPVGRQAAFNTTHWSVVLAVTQGDCSRAREALAKLCQTYWYPLYAYTKSSLANR